MKSVADKIDESLNYLDIFIKRKEIGSKIKSELEIIFENISIYKTRLEEIEGLYAIDYDKDIDPKLLESSSIFNNLPYGRISNENLKQLTIISPLLNSLYKKGIDINSIYKFSQNEIDFSKEIGNNFSDLSEILQSLRKQKKKEGTEREFSALMPLKKSLGKAILILEKYKIFKIKRMLQKKSDNQWAPFKREWIRGNDEDKNILTVYDLIDNNMARILQGEWLNCYVYQIINDQLSRNSVNYELYTNVAYSAPRDLIRHASDFDVVGKIQDTVVCVECKTGRLDVQRNDLQSIVDKTNDLKAVLSKIGGQEMSFKFFLAYDHTLNDEAKINDFFEKHEITPVLPTDIRGVMTKAFGI